MKKYLISGSLAVALLLPGLAFAAYNDVSLTTDAVLKVNGFNLNINGSTAVVESVVVGSTSFTVTLKPGSSIQIKSTDRKTLSSSAGANYIVTDTCDDTQSILALSPTISSDTVTITPSGTCTSGSTATGSSSTVTTTSSNSGSGSGSNGAPVASGGGGGTVQVTAIVPTAPTGSGDKQVQLTQQLNALTAQIQALKGGTSAPINPFAAAVSASSFKRDVQVGSKGDDVKSLQMYLNARGFSVAAKGVGSPGKETTTFGSATRAALLKFQKAVGITPATGYFGPKTRAYIATH